MTSISELCSIIYQPAIANLIWLFNIEEHVLKVVEKAIKKKGAAKQDF